MITAVLIDGGFFLKAYPHCYPDGGPHSPKQVAETLHDLACRHADVSNVESEELYRIFYYDCPPLTKKAHHPIAKKNIDFSKSEIALFRFEFFKELKRLRKVALRLGHLQEVGEWAIYPGKVKDLLNGKLPLTELGENDVFYNVRQKGVDMRIGIDIAAMSYRKLVNRMVLISNDGDFITPAKLARREGVDFILDPMWHPVNEDLQLHLDGIRTLSPRPARKE